MQIRGRALYNLLRLTEVDRRNVKKWQIENYRQLSDEDIFDRLSNLKIFIDYESFPHFARSVDTPEELLEYLVSTEYSQPQAEQIYLLLFELWRRHLKGRESLSILCDELDHLMEQYDNGHGEVAEDLYSDLYQLVDIIDESVNEEQSANEVLEYISSYLAHDLESFLYDFIGHLIENQEESAASELIEGYEDYVTNKQELEFLKLKLIFASDAVETDGMMALFSDELVEEGNVDLACDFLDFILKEGEIFTFFTLFPKVLSLVANKLQYAKLIKIASGYLDTLDSKHEHRLLLHELIEKKSAEFPM
ncbi:MAG: hypothetical protein P0S95_05355 [Rhabdochlamydiaceae bacterium]|nr:hypothetical protein [Candidatus Amphrikana amoebophyrae]